MMYVLGDVPADVEAILNDLDDDLVFVDEIPMDPFLLTDLIDSHNAKEAWS